MTAKNPLPEGFTIRPATMDDLEEAVDLFNLCSIEITGERGHSHSEIENEWKTPGFSQETDQRLVFSPEGKMVGYTEAWTISDTPVHPWIWGRVHPDYKGLGIGTHMLDWAAQRVSQVVEKVPPDARITYRTGTIEGHAPSNELLRNYGLDLIRHSFQMRIELDHPIPAPVWPEGIQMRTFRPEDAKAVYLADDEAFQDHFGYVPEDEETGFAQFSHHFYENEDFDPGFFFLAMDGDEIAGFSLCRSRSREDENMGWISSLGVRRPWRKRGLGLALLHHSFGVMQQAGRLRAGLGVDAENLTGALRLYKKAGMHVHYQYNLYEKELRPGKELSTVSVDSD